MDAEVAVDRDDVGRIVIRPTGELDLATLHPLAAAMRSCDDGARVVIDLANVTFLDSSVLSLLAESHRRCEVTVTGARGVLRRTFEVAGMDSMLAE